MDSFELYEDKGAKQKGSITHRAMIAKCPYCHVEVASWEGVKHSERHTQENNHQQRVRGILLGQQFSHTSGCAAKWVYYTLSRWSTGRANAGDAASIARWLVYAGVIEAESIVSTKPVWRNSTLNATQVALNKQLIDSLPKSCGSEVAITIEAALHQMSDVWK